MKTYLFIATHLGSGGTMLCRMLNSTNKVAIPFTTNIKYGHPDDLKELNTQIILSHNCTTHAPVYGDKLLYNYSLYCKQFYNIGKFIYLVREPVNSLKHIIGSKKYHPYGAFAYYRFRLRGMYEMARRTGGILVTYDDLINLKALPFIEDYLEIGKLSKYYDIFPADMDENLKSGKILNVTKEPDVFIPDSNIVDCYNDYIQKISNALSR